jgi:hypothetical protein
MPWIAKRDLRPRSHILRSCQGCFFRESSVGYLGTSFARLFQSTLEKSSLGLGSIGRRCPFFTRGAGKEEAPITVLVCPAPRGSNTDGDYRSGSYLNARGASFQLEILWLRMRVLSLLWGACAFGIAGDHLLQYFYFRSTIQFPLMSKFRFLKKIR